MPVTPFKAPAKQWAFFIKNNFEQYYLKYKIVNSNSLFAI